LRENYPEAFQILLEILRSLYKFTEQLCWTLWGSQPEPWIIKSTVQT